MGVRSDDDAHDKKVSMVEINQNENSIKVKPGQQLQHLPILMNHRKKITRTRARFWEGQK